MTAPKPFGTIPANPAMPILGWRGNAIRFFRNPIKDMTRLYRQFGPLVRLAEGGNKTLFYRSDRRHQASVFALGSDCARELLTDTETFITKRPPGPDTPTFDRLCTNMFFLNGERHLQQRKLFMNAFSRENLQAYYDDMVHYTQRMLDRWQPGRKLDIQEEMNEVTLQIGSKTLYGIEASHDRQSLARRMSDMIYMLFSPLTMVPLNLPGTPFRRLIKLSERIEQELMAEIERKRQSGGGDDLLTQMVKQHDEDPEQLTYDELIGQAFTMFFAGHDTASKALTWSLFLIAQHPEVHRRLHEELDRELGGEPPSYGKVYKLDVLDRVVKEALRICTPAVVFTREATEDASICGYEIPAGTEVLYSPYVIHTDPAIWDQPYVFDPDRWLDVSPGRYEYLPFGVGRRTCLGVSFGGLQLRLMLSLIVQRARIEIPDGTEIDLKTNVVIAPAKGLPAVVRAQDGRYDNCPGEVSGYVREMVEM